MWASRLITVVTMALVALAALALFKPGETPPAQHQAARQRPASADPRHGDGSGLSIEADLRHRAARSELPAQRKIRDGRAIPEGGFADVVWLHTSSTPPAPGQAAGTGVCSGTLIASDAVLTALHCVCFHGLRAAMFGNAAEADDRQWIKLKPPQLDWSRCDSLFPGEDDVALVRLERPPAGIAPRLLAPAETIDAARAYTVVGFGSIGVGAGEQGVKRGTMVGRASASCAGQVPASDPPRTDSAAYGCRPGREIVAGAMPGSDLSPDTCAGDSGGPLYVSPSLPAIGDPPEEQMRLAGVTSRPTARQRQQCGDGGIYVRLTAEIRSWLEAELARPPP